jgi:porin
MSFRFLRTGAFGFALICLSAAAGHAQDVPDMDDIATNIFQQETLLGHSIATRKTLEDKGVSLGADEIFDTLGNPTGGDKQGLAFEGRFELFASIDLQKALGLDGLLFHVNAYQIHGNGLSADDVGNLLTVSNIGAKSSTRLFGLWLQKSLYNDTLSIRAGQLAADDEFFISQYASLFINSAFGWPSIMGINLPSGGPAYPLATPGMRVKWAISPALVATTAIFNGDPAPAGPGDAQTRDAAGVNFRLNGNLFWISELAYTASLPIGSDTLPGTFKLGGWYHDGVFLDQRYDTAGLSLANPASGGFAAPHRGNFGAYVIADQQLWRPQGATGQGLAAFFRAGGDPGMRNLIEFHFDTGISYAGLFPGRDSDTIGLGFSYDQVGSAARALGQDQARFASLALPAPDFESALELTYQAQVAPWWILQPDAQLILHPGARLGATPSPPGNAVVLGFRTAISF